jgi:hypothetical protein
MNILEWLRAALKSSYTRMLESEVERLRAENRALLNSVMTQAGLPPIEHDRNAPAAVGGPTRESWQAIAQRREANSFKHSEVGRRVLGRPLPTEIPQPAERKS